MTAAYELPLSAANQRFSITLGQVEYMLIVTWRAAIEAGGTIDIASSAGTPIVSGVPLVTGTDLLEQYRHLEIGGGGSLYVATDGDPDAVPTFDGLGAATKLYWVPDA